MHALSYEIPARSATGEEVQFQMRLADEGRIEIGVYEEGKLVSGKVKTDGTSLYNVIHGWRVELRDGRSGELRIEEQFGSVKLRYQRTFDGLSFEARAGSEEFARRVHSLGGLMIY
jgi:hypothetical protein